MPIKGISPKSHTYSKKRIKLIYLLQFIKIIVILNLRRITEKGKGKENTK